jgi:hypothetical protein
MNRRKDNQMIYAFGTPSDPITFRADTDQVAFAVGLYLGRGKAFVRREDGTELPCFLLFARAESVASMIEERLGTSFALFVSSHRRECAAAFESFCYGNIAKRREYEAACSAITDPDKLAEFKRAHEDANRTSMTKWVAEAWTIGAALRKMADEEGQPSEKKG